jgi:hypothetical protein
MSDPRPLRPLAPHGPSLASRASEDLRFIRQTMERAASFTALPGWGGVLMGVIALLATPAALNAGSHWAWLCTWLGAALLATTCWRCMSIIWVGKMRLCWPGAKRMLFIVLVVILIFGMMLFRSRNCAERA